MKKLLSKINGSKHKKLIWTGIIILILALILIVRRLIVGEQLMMVETADATVSEIEELVNLSGSVVSGSSDTVYATFTAKVADAVSVGTMVKEGDIVLKYDESSLEEAATLASLQETVDTGNYKEAVYQNGLKYDDVYIAGLSMSECKEQLRALDEQIRNLERAIEKKEQEINTTLAARTKQLAEGDISVSEEEAQNQLTYDRSTSQYDPFLIDMQHDLDDKKDLQNKISSRLSGLEMAKGAGGVEAGKASYEIANMNNQKALEDIEASREGVKSSINGIVTAVGIETGKNTTPGGALFTISSLDDVYVDIKLSKVDISKVMVGQKVDIVFLGNSYEGEVAEVGSLATLNENKNPVVSAKVKIINPDEHIVLGLEAKCIVHGKKKSDAIVIPAEAVNVDADGEFVYVLGEDSVIVRKDIVTDINTTKFSDVAEGLNVGDTVITNVNELIVEGARARSASDILPEQGQTGTETENQNN